MKRVPRVVWFVCRLVIAVVLVALLVRSLDMPALIRQMTDIDRRWLSACLVIPLLGIGLSALRWQAVLEMLGVRRPYGELLLRYWSGAFYNAVLPGSVGGDVVRVGGLARGGVPITSATLSVLSDRSVGLWAGMLLGFLSSIWPSQVPYRRTLGLLFGSIVAAGALVVWLAPMLRHSLPAWLGRYASVGAALAGLRWWYLIGLACMFQALVLLHLYVAARALHAPIPLLVCALYAPAVVFTTMLPISLNGIGVREATLVILLGGIGVAPETAALIGFLIYVTSAISTLPGGLAASGLPIRVHDDSSPSKL